MKHKLKRIFNSRMLSRALICVITCSIIFSYAVLCPQAEGSYTFYSLGPYTVEHSERSYDFLGKDIISLLDFVPETYLYYNPISGPYALSIDSDGNNVLNGTWAFSSFQELSFISPGIYNFSFDYSLQSYFDVIHCTSMLYTDSDVLYFIDDSGGYHQVYSNGYYSPIYIYFENTVVTDYNILRFITSNFYCTNLNAIYNSMYYYPISLNFSNYVTDFINISFSLAFPYNYDLENIYDFDASSIFVYSDFYRLDSYLNVPFTLLSTRQLIGDDEFTGVSYIYISYDFVLDLSSFSNVENVLAFVPFATFNTSMVGYSEAAVFISPLTIESFSSVDQAFFNSINNVTNKLEETNATLNNIQNTLTEVSPEMQQSLDSLETLIQDEAGKVEDVINGMEQIGTDFGTEIGDFDNILNENAGTLEDIGSTTYNSFINDVFGNWFFVSMFALFGAFAFFSRAVFG